MKFSNPVIVLGGDLGGLGLVRAFGRRGIETYLVVDQRDAAVFSKYCRRGFILPEMRQDRSVLKDFLRKMTNSLSKRSVVYPTSDLDALNLSKVKDELSDDFYFVVGDEEPVELLVEKSKFYKALDRKGIDHPTTYFPENVEDVQRIGTEITYPIFIRPSNSQLFKQTFGSGKGFFAHSSKELVDYFRLATRHGVEVMFQEIIPGPPSNSYQLEGYYNRDRSPTVLFARQRLRIWPLDFGNTTLCVSIPLTRLDNERKMVNDFIKAIGYQGLMSAEFKEDARDGKLKFLEVNARAWWHFWLSSYCGADIIFSSYLDMIGEKTEYVETYRTGVRSTYLLADVRASIEMFLNGDIGFLDYSFSSLYSAIDAFLQKDDLAPFVMDCAIKGFQLLREQKLSKARSKLELL